MACSRAWRRRVAGAWCVAVLAAGGCGIPLDESARDLPYRAGDGPTNGTTTTRTASSAGSGTAFVWYWVAPAERLVPRLRRLDHTDAAGLLNAALVAQTSEERVNQISTLVPENTTVRSPPVLRHGTLTVDLRGPIERLDASAQWELFAQLTLTMAAVPRVRLVRYRVNGKAIQVTGSDGQLTRVSVCDVAELVADPASELPAVATDAEKAALTARRAAIERDC